MVKSGIYKRNSKTMGQRKCKDNMNDDCYVCCDICKRFLPSRIIENADDDDELLKICIYCRKKFSKMQEMRETQASMALSMMPE